MELHDEFMDTPVSGAIRNGHVAVLDELLAAGLDVNGVDAFATTVLQMAAFHGQHKMVQQLLINDASVDGGANSRSMLMALHLAAMSGSERCVGALLDARADPNAVGGVDADGGGRRKRQTALHFAAEAGHAQCVAVLLERADGGREFNQPESYRRQSRRRTLSHLERLRRCCRAVRPLGPVRT